MTVDTETQPIPERFKHLHTLISSERFLKMQGLGKEVPFYICPYRPFEAIEMERMQKQLKNKLAQMGIQVLGINLYDISVEILKENGDWEWYLEEEVKMTKDELQEELQSILDIETVLVPAIAKRIIKQDHDVIFMSGVGEVFPYIRSHNVLNNLQSTAKDHPMVMFFPGQYTHSLESGASLDLFGKLHDDKYYRAFNIYHCEI
ncbi:MAG: DUF1788 domain-containing protein [Desulfobacteraceae bacterium]|nr:DUF1788 domain-containing protein [Desulfobacteraceae bacterium]